MSERRLLTPVKEGGGGALPGKAPEGYVLWPHKEEPRAGVRELPAGLALGWLGGCHRA